MDKLWRGPKKEFNKRRFNIIGEYDIIEITDTSITVVVEPGRRVNIEYAIVILEES